MKLKDLKAAIADIYDDITINKGLITAKRNDSKSFKKTTAKQTFEQLKRRQ